MTTQHDAAIETVAHVLYDALRPETSPPHWLCERAAVAISALSATPAPRDEVARLQSCYEQIEKAARDYADNYMLDEAADEDDCVCGREQHLRAVALFDALADVSRARAVLGLEVGEG